MALEFPPLSASDVEARVAQCSEKGLSLLLYKDARCDMRMLDRAVGPERWQCRYETIGGKLFCSVGIKFGDEWVWKSDVGKPSDMEKEKGEASDAFKRACFKWGIGRELYTAPFIWINPGDYKPAKNKQGKPTCYDRFTVDGMEVEDGRITSVTIRNERMGRTVWGKGAKPSGKPEGKPDDSPGSKPSDDNSKLVARQMRLMGLQQQATELGMAEDYVEAESARMHGKAVKDLSLDELDELGKFVKGVIERVEGGDA